MSDMPPDLTDPMEFIEPPNEEDLNGINMARRIDAGIEGAPVPENVKEYMRTAETFTEGEPLGPPQVFVPWVAPEDQGDDIAGQVEPRELERISYQDTLEEARASGYSWPEIHTHIAASTATAADEGYSQAEIDDHLGLQDSENIEPLLRLDWAKRFAADPELVTGLSSPNPKIDLSVSDDLWTDYGEALLNGEVRGPEDFALSYAASALNAAHELMDVDASDPLVRQERQAAAAESADLIAAQLPTREDLADATVAMTMDADLDPADVRKALVANWTETGMSPVEAAARAKADPSFAERLLSPDTPLGALASSLAEYGVAATELATTLKNIGVGIVEGFHYPDEDYQKRIEALKKEPAGAEALAAALTRVLTVPGSMAFDALLFQFPDIFKRVAEGKGVSVEEALAVSLSMVGPSVVRGYGLQPVVPEILPPLPREGIGGPGPRGPGPIIEGEAVGPLIQLPEPPPLPIINLEAQLGAPPRSLPAREALQPPPRTQEVVHNTAADLSLVGAEERIRMVAEPAFQQELAIRMADDVVLPGVKRTSNPIVVWHGSPHTFNDFSLGKIGTGEGAQAFGYGLYFADAPSVAGAYKEPSDVSFVLEGKRYFEDELDNFSAPQMHAISEFMRQKGNIRQAKESLEKSKAAGWGAQTDSDIRAQLQYRQEAQVSDAQVAERRAQYVVEDTRMALEIDEAKQWLDDNGNQLAMPEGNIYKVNLHVDPNLLLDLDKPIAQQAPPVIAALEKLHPAWDMAATGREIMDRLENRFGRAGASEELQKAGLHGNRYLDQGSRNAVQLQMLRPGPQASLPKGTSNYVIFHDSKIEALERNGTPIKPAEAAAKAQEMAEGYDAARALYNHFYSSTIEMLKDERGSLNLGALFAWRTPEGRAAHDEFSRARDMLHRIAIPNLMRPVQSDVLLARMMDDYQPLIAPHINAFARASRAGDGQAMIDSEVGKLLHYIENRTWGGTLQNSKLAPLADALRAIADHGEAEMQQAFAEGLIDMPTLIENWFKHLWKNPKGVNFDFPGAHGEGGPGSASFLHKRHFPKMADGMKLGASPMFDNPISQALYGEQQRAFYLTGLRIVKEAMGEGVLYYATKPRKPGDIKVNGVAPRGGAAFKQGNPPMTPIFEEIYGDPGFVRGYNNAMAKGMNAHPTSAATYMRLLWFGNMTTALKLLWPGFHLRTISVGALGTGYALTMEHAARAVKHGAKAAIGLSAAEAAEAGKEILKAMGRGAATVTIAPMLAETSWVGFRSVYRYNRGMMDETLTLLSEAGLRITPRQQIYNMGRAETFTKVAARGGFRPWEAGRSLAQGEVRQAVRHLDVVGGGAELMRELGRDIQAAAGDPRLEGMGQRIFKGALYRVPIGLPMTEAGRVLQTATSPVFDYYIPALKVGAGYIRMKSWLDANPFATPEEKWFQARQIVKDIENRIGELNMDVMFAPKLAKHIALVTLLSLGWKYGSWRAFLGMMGWDIERGGRMGKIAFSPVLMTSFVGTLAMYMQLNAIEQYLHTGTFPWQTNTMTADFMNARLGGLSTSGAPARLMDPAELKEQYDLAKIVLTSIYSPKDGPHAAAEYVLNALNPFWKVVYETTITGKDGIGKSVWDRPGGYEAYLKEAFGPILFNSMENIRQGSGLTKFEVLMGTREAGRWVTDWNAHVKGMEKGHEKATKEELRRAQREQERLKGIKPPSGGGRGGGANRSEQNNRPLGSPSGGRGGANRSEQNNRPLK